MNTNLKLALKVLKSMDEDFIRLEASLIHMTDIEARNKIFFEIREKREAVSKLRDYYQRLLSRQPQ